MKTNEQARQEAIKAGWAKVLRVKFSQVEKGIDEEGWYSNERNGDWLPHFGFISGMVDFRLNNTEIRPKSLNG